MSLRYPSGRIPCSLGARPPERLTQTWNSSPCSRITKFLSLTCFHPKEFKHHYPLVLLGLVCLASKVLSHANACTRPQLNLPGVNSLPLGQCKEFTLTKSVLSCVTISLYLLNPAMTGQEEDMVTLIIRPLGATRWGTLTADLHVPLAVEPPTCQLGLMFTSTQSLDMCVLPVSPHMQSRNSPGFGHWECWVGFRTLPRKDWAVCVHGVFRWGWKL